MKFTKTLQQQKGSNQNEKENAINRRRLAEGKAPLKSLIQVFAVKEYDSEDRSAPIMDNWEVVRLDGEGFHLQFNFSNPLHVSVDDEPDIMLIQLDLSGFVDENG